MQTAVWNDIPPLRELLAAAAHNRRLAVCLPEKRITRFEPSEQPDEAERRFLQHWPQQSACLQFAAANILHGLLPQGAELWLMPPAAADCLSDYFSDGLEWQTEARPQSPAAAQKPWFRPSENRNGTPPEHVAVIGAGAYALHEARILLPHAAHVCLLSNGVPPAIKIPNEIAAESRRIARIEGERRVRRIVFADGTEMEADGVFIAIGTPGATELAQKLGILLNDGKIVVDEHMATNVPGVYAAGDCTGGLLQIAKAVYEGAEAGLAVLRYLQN